MGSRLNDGDNQRADVEVREKTEMIKIRESYRTILSIIQTLVKRVFFLILARLSSFLFLSLSCWNLRINIFLIQIISTWVYSQKDYSHTHTHTHLPRCAAAYNGIIGSFVKTIFSISFSTYYSSHHGSEWWYYYATPL